MAKMFYSAEEVQEKLGISEDDLKQYVQDRKLREFRDGAKVMFKVDEVDALAGPGSGPDEEFDLGGSSEIGLAPLGSSVGDVSLGDESGPTGDADLDATDFNLELADDLGSPEELDLGDEAGASGSEIGLIPMDTGSQAGLVPDDSADKINLDDTSEGGANKDDTVITEHGVEVLDDSAELDLADPMAQTQLAPDFNDQVVLDSGSSGSGLLDLTREADDTSLGAELLDEIYPGQDGGGESQVPTQLNLDVRTPDGEESSATLDVTQPAIPDFGAGGPGMVTMPAPVVDPTSGAYGAALVVPFLLLVYLGFVTASAMTGASGDVSMGLSDYIWYVVGAGAVASILIAVIGAGMSSMAGKPNAAKGPKSKPAKAAKAPKAPKEKKSKKK
ncbi:MAG: helix-turn-helix domain-containing protein [Sedimentisphaerales bacterium]|nr:helix-turn-helix domain-containing protein [Sedimentisphaerales bacterium]